MPPKSLVEGMLPLALYSTLLLFSTSRVSRISIMELWKRPHSSNARCRYHIMLSLCALMVLILASSASSSGLFAVIAPPAAHRPRAPSPRFARFLYAMELCACCRTCSVSCNLVMEKLRSRISCFAEASTSFLWASVRYFASLSADRVPFEPLVRAICFRRGGCAVER